MQHSYEVLIIGGGIAGLSAAALFARAGFATAVFEKEDYPRHKVCGEYISRESVPFLKEIGLETDHLPQIDRFLLSTTGGQTLAANLPLGGFGMSRYAFDAALADCAQKAGAVLFTQTKVESISDLGAAGFEMRTSNGLFSGKLALGSWGKKSNLDVQLQRPFLRKTDAVLDGWVGIKHHIRYANHPEDLIALHHFGGGYCGISRVEADRLCLCYLVRGEALRKAGNSIFNLEETVLCRNPFLKSIWRDAEFLYPKPLAISGISFQKRSPVINGVLCLGDSAGLIPPLSGNGMSMALHSAKIAFEHGSAFLNRTKKRTDLERDFTRAWNRQFRRRMWMGRLLQGRFGSEALLSPTISLLNAVPFLKSAVIRSTHGTAF